MRCAGPTFADSTDGDEILFTVRRSKTNPEGNVNDVRFVKDGVARALRTLRAATRPEPDDRVVPLSAQMIGLRCSATAQVADVESRVTAHSGRVGVGVAKPGRVDHRRDARRETGRPAAWWRTTLLAQRRNAGLSHGTCRNQTPEDLF